MLVSRRFVLQPSVPHRSKYGNALIGCKHTAAAIAIALMCIAHLALAQRPAKYEFAGSTAMQEGDRVAAEQVFGPEWKALARRAGMIFVGTVIASSQPESSGDSPGPLPSSIEISFNVELGIAGAETGQTLTIHEWANAVRRPMRPGQRYLLLLYPPSRLGLTSAVGGSLGEVRLDASGKHVAEIKSDTASPPSAAVGLSFQPPHSQAASIQVIQLERAIRNARSSPTN